MGLSTAGALAIQSGINVGSGLIDNAFAKRNLKWQTDANMEMANYAYGKDQEMWHMQNLYNQPKNQMQRFSEAGLNPNLIYGQGNAGNASQMPKRQPVTSGLLKTKIPRANVIQEYQNLKQQNAQIANIDANTNHTLKLTDNANFTGTIKAIDAEMRDISLRWMQGKNTIRPEYGGNYFLSKQRSLQSQNYQYSLQNAKQQLLELQINNAYQQLLTRQRQYKWMPWEKGAGIAGKAVGSAIGFRGAKSIGKLSSGRPKFSKYTKNQYRKNQDISPNFNF